MSFKNLLKKKLGNHYYKIRSKYILTKLFGKYYLNTRSIIKKFTSNFSFIKKNLNKKIEYQSIINKES